MGTVVTDIATSVEVDHAVQEIGQSWYKAVESIIDTATLLHKYKKSKLWKPILSAISVSPTLKSEKAFIPITSGVVIGSRKTKRNFRCLERDEPYYLVSTFLINLPLMFH